MTDEMNTSMHSTMDGTLTNKVRDLHEDKLRLERVLSSVVLQRDHAWKTIEELQGPARLERDAELKHVRGQLELTEKRLAEMKGLRDLSVKQRDEALSRRVWRQTPSHNEIESERNARLAATEALACVAKERDELQDELQDQIAGHDKTEKALRDTETALGQARTELHNVRREFAGADRGYDAVTEELSHLKGVLKEREDLTRSHLAHIDNLKAEIKKSNVEQNSLQQRCENQRDTIDTMMKQAAKMRTDYDKLVAELIERSKRIEDLERYLAAEKKDREESRRSSANNYDNLMHERVLYKKLEDEHNALKAEHDRSVSENDLREEQLLNRASGQLQAAQTVIQDLRQGSEQLRNRLAEVAGDINSLRNHLDEVASERDTCRVSLVNSNEQSARFFAVSFVLAMIVVGLGAAYIIRALING